MKLEARPARPARPARWTQSVFLCATTVYMAVHSANADGQPIRYVDDDAPLAGDGLSWQTAYRYLQDAMWDVGEEDVQFIRVAQGAYRPDLDEGGNVTPLEQGETFELAAGLTITGGHRGAFDGSGENPNDWNVDAFPTVLTGDLLGDDGASPLKARQDNSHHLLSADDALDIFIVGLTVAHGGHLHQGGGLEAWDSDITLHLCRFESNVGNQGGGVYADGTDLTVTNCTFSNCWAGWPGGGGMYVIHGTLIVTDCDFLECGADPGVSGAMHLVIVDATISRSNFVGNTAFIGSAAIGAVACDLSLESCVFQDNRATGAGIGALESRLEGTLSVNNCQFRSNEGNSGAGAMWLEQAAVLRNCTFTQNTSIDNGYAGAIYNESDLTVINCLFAENDVEGYRGMNGGGAIQNADTGSLTIINCTLAGNSANRDGPGSGIDNERGFVSIANCVLWNNGPDEASQVSGSGGTLAVNFSCVQGLTGALGGVGNIGVDPLFDDEWRLLPGSPCIDAGLNIVVPAYVTTDLDGNPRFVDDPATDDTGFGKAPIVDIGAFEFQINACLADINNDGAVGPADLSIILGNWGPVPPGDPAADLNGDGAVDAADLAIVLGNWGPCP